MTDALEGRVQDIEDLIADIPQMISLRMESLTASQQEASARIGLLDKQMAMVLREMRDLRGGVTRMLVAQDAEIAAIKTDVLALKGDVSGIETRIAKIEGDVAEIKAGMHAILARLP